MQLDKEGEVGGLRRSYEMYGRNMIKKAHAKPFVKGLPHQNNGKHPLTNRRLQKVSESGLII